ncbi:MAG: TatD family hydrolase [Calditrichaeota bacterium]|nr:TatD family hydrolase [Calditrichota bacterium]
MLIETHAHLYFDGFDDDREAVIQRAFEANVKRIINIGLDIDTGKECIKLAEKHDGLFATVGIHPNDSARLTNAALEELGKLAAHNKVVAIGEIGLDFYWDKCPVPVQQEAFRKQIQLAKELALPIVIHNREAGREIVDVLKSEGIDNLTGVLHCFSEGADIAQEVLDLGFYVSFTGNLTFKKSELPAVAQMVPLQRLLLETDCPFLSPEPRRGRRNEPAHVVHIAQKLAEIKQVEFGQIEEATTENACRLFGIG